MADVVPTAELHTPRIEHQRSVTTERILTHDWVDSDLLARWLRLYGHIGWRSWFRRRHRDYMEVAIKDGRLIMRRIEWPDE